MLPERDRLPSEVYQIKVALLGIEPEIWRRLLAPPEMTLRRFSEAIAIAMGWTGGHLHEFRAGKALYGEPDDDHDSYQITRRQNDRKVPLRKMLGRLGSKAVYTYDFADDWQHSIVLEKRLKADPATKYPLCTGGEMACPPEDCGGLPGYYNLLRTNRAYDPTAFSLEQVNRALQRRSWRARP
jgi:hypothetical protein